jgi:Arc/MetJ family transcription regulator
MKTTIDLPDDLLVAAKQRAASERTTLRAMVERGLRAQLGAPGRSRRKPRAVRWVTVAGGLPPEVDLTDREAMSAWLLRTR